LNGFLRRTRILARPESSIAQIEATFDHLWDSGELQREVLGASETKEEDSLLCKACAKKFANQAVYDAHLLGRKHKKNSEIQERLDGQSESGTGGGKSGSANLKTRAVLYHEYAIKALADLLEKEINDTIANVERRRALTDRERQLEIAALEEEILGPDELSSSDDDDQKSGSDSDDDGLYNPLKLPLGYDGKPIPFWLWKLNGLGIEYKCEICGNYTYMGRRAFERHFLEGRHTHGLRCLGIQPGMLFKNITSINEALALWEKLNSEETQKETKPETTVEMEDEEGNVMSEKVYNDLKKQGLL
jgi:splicing factor 3A subunit 3